MKKKSYDTPAVRLMQVDSEQLIAQSIGIDKGTVVSGEDGGWAKENRSGYNVWNEDWSK